jgi:hypothetical protein
VKESGNRRFSKCLRRVAAAIVASRTAATSLAYAWPSDKPIVVQPAALPELARQAGQAMLLHNSDDGRTLLYVEQSQGTRLAIFDVTNPARIKSAGAMQLDAPGPFDFVSKVGNQAEIVRFLDGKGDAVLDLNEANAPALETAADRGRYYCDEPNRLQHAALSGLSVSRNREFGRVQRRPRCEADSSASDESRHRDHLPAHGKWLISDRTPDRRAGQGAS